MASYRICLALLTFAVAPAAMAEDAVPWEPLRFGTIAQDFAAPWAPPPDGSSGAPRQGWLGVQDGFFTREWHLAYDNTEIEDGEDRQTALFRYNRPLTRRFWFGAEVPFIVDEGGETDFGDVTVTTQIMLRETRDLSLNWSNALRLPTGEAETGGDLWAFDTGLNLWTDLGAGISARGAIGYGSDEGGNGIARVSAALGQTINPRRIGLGGQFTYSVAASYVDPEDGDDLTTLTPALRMRLARAPIFGLLGVEMPVGGAGEDSFEQRVILQIVRGF
ncbi:MAG: hypothetical protein AAF919_00700 [Pseudomonadota bacterium]